MKFFILLIVFLSLNVHANNKLGLGASIGSPIGLHYFY